MKERLVGLLLSFLSYQGNAAILPWCLDQIADLFRDNPERFRQFLKPYCDSDSWFYRFVAAYEIGEVYKHAPDWSLRKLEELSKDDNDLVLEACAHSWSVALRTDFDEVFERIKGLQREGNYRERRTAALAPVEYYRDGSPSPSRKERIESFWATYNEDERQGLSNLVESQIMDEIVHHE
jgi:hypothetical protein